MWHYYKKTFALVQIAALLVSTAVYRGLNYTTLVPPAVFFLSMQVSAVFGAMWADRLRRKIQAAPRA
jgi:hypothetical protein